MAWKTLGGRTQLPLNGFGSLHERLTPTVRPLNSPSSVSNLLHVRAPSLGTRPGYTQIGTQIQNAPVQGIHEYVNTAGTTRQVLAQAGTTLARWTGAVWQTITATAPNTKFGAANLTDLACLFWAGSPAQKWNGTTLVPLGGTPPQGNLVVEAFQRLFVAGVPGYEGTIFWSGVRQPENWTVLADGGFQTIAEGIITHVAYDRHSTNVVIWTTKEVQLLYGPSQGDTSGLWTFNARSTFGCVNGRTVIQIDNRWIWLSADEEKRGFVMWSGGAETDTYYLLSTSTALIDWNNIANACAFKDAEGRYYCSCPKVGGGIIWFIYDHLTDEWQTGTGVDIRSYGGVTVNAQDSSWFGSNQGYVYQSGGQSDNGTPISFDVTLGPTTFGENFVKTQVVQLDIVVTAQPGSLIQAAVSTTETGGFGGTATLAATTQLSAYTISVPISPSEFRDATIWRLRVFGYGVVELHDVLFTTYKQGRR